MDSQPVSVELTNEEREFLMTLMISRPPRGSESGLIEGNDDIERVPTADYARLWRSIDDKLRSA